MDLRVRQVERAAERMTQLVVKAHAGRAERRASETRPVQRLAARPEIRRVVDDHGQRLGE